MGEELNVLRLSTVDSMLMQATESYITHLSKTLGCLLYTSPSPRDS